MAKIKVIAAGAELCAQIEGPLTSGMIGLPVAFAFDETWAGLIKTAVFKAGNVIRNVVGIEGEAVVPWEVMREVGCTLQVGVYGLNEAGTLALPTVWADVGTIEEGADPDGDPSTDPSLPMWQQLVNKNNEQDRFLQAILNREIALEEAAKAAKEVVDAYKSGKLGSGVYGIPDTEGKYVHTTGNGRSEDERSNAHTIDWAGNAWFAGDVYVGGTGQDDPDAKRLATIEDVNALDTAFIAEYKVTTYAELKAAWDKGQKHMLLKVTGNNIEWLAPLYCWEPSGFSFRLMNSTQEKIWWCHRTGGWSSKFVSIPTVQSTQEYIDQQLGVIENGSY